MPGRGPQRSSGLQALGSGLQALGSGLEALGSGLRALGSELGREAEIGLVELYICPYDSGC